jgi:hypothetical protein
MPALSLRGESTSNIYNHDDLEMTFGPRLTFQSWSFGTRSIGCYPFLELLIMKYRFPSIPFCQSRTCESYTWPNKFGHTARLLFVVGSMLFAGTIQADEDLTFCCDRDNDVYRLVERQWGSVPRFEDPSDAVAAAAQGGAVCIFADKYPENTTVIDESVYRRASEKGLRLYVEFPSYVPGVTFDTPRRTHYERAVVANDWFSPELEPMRILGLNDCTFLPVVSPHELDASLVVAKVAGLDEAVFGLENMETFPILFTTRHGSESIIVCTSNLSGCVTGRYAPSNAWGKVWTKIFQELQPGKEIARLSWTPTVRPTYASETPLPPDVEREAVRRGVEWLYNARMLVHPDWNSYYDENANEYKDRVAPAPDCDWPVGDGSLGVLEGFNANIFADGSQRARWWRRSDCNGEASGMLAVAGTMLDEERHLTTSRNIGDYWLFESIASNGVRVDAAHPEYGLIGWNDVPVGHGAGVGVYYGDDHARFILGITAASGVLEANEWDERLLRFLYACARTTGRTGFRRGRINSPDLNDGWETLFGAAPTNYHPHYESYLWAALLWAYDQTGDPIFLDRTKNAIKRTMEAYPDQWRWTNGIQQERARMLLSLAWLVRIEDTPQHREWLDRMFRELIRGQEPCGAIREEIGGPGLGQYGPPASNTAYGTSEAPLIQSNDDRICDLLYTTNFAFLGIHEAAAATGDPEYQAAADRLADFLCRIQVSSETKPEFDGAWFRAFDFNRWEYWASNADHGWGAWSIEVGWTQAWIVSVLAMREMDASLWELSRNERLREIAPSIRREMIPDDVLESLQGRTQ